MADESGNTLNMKEDVFRSVCASGAIENVSLEWDDMGVLIHYRTSSGHAGLVVTKRGANKRYRTDTALRFLRDAGMEHIELRVIPPN